MRLGTVTAGCIAGVVVACAGPGLDAIGDGMRDAGAMLAGRDAGGVGGAAGISQPSAAGKSAAVGGTGGTAHSVTVDAGRMVVDAGQAIVDAGHAVDASRAVLAQDAAEPAGDGLPRPHWVLRGADGAAVQADVVPGYAASADRFIDAPECVYVQHVGQRRIGLSYQLATGKLSVAGECNQSASTLIATWHDTTQAYYLDDVCAGPAYVPSAGIVLTVGSIPYYSAGVPVVVTAYRWQASTQQCVQLSGPVTMWPYTTVPATVTELLSHAPYSITLVY